MSKSGEIDVCEAVVVGGGPAGTAAAITLARTGRSVLLLEAASDLTFKIGEALPPASRPLLQKLGVWDGFLADGHLPCYGNLSAWGSSHLESTDFIFDPHGHGWHLDRPRFDALLRREASLAGAGVSMGTTFSKWTRQLSGGWLLTLMQEGQEMKVACRWLIDATGRRCIVARREGERRRADDTLVALFAVFNPTEDLKQANQDSRTLIEAAPDGWWYTALLPSNQRIVVYLTDADLAPRGPDVESAYTALLSRTKHIHACLTTGKYSLSTAPKVAPANTSRLNHPTGDGWLAIGDAALSFDPLSAQGIFTSLYTGMEAGLALVESLSGSSNALANYGNRLATIYRAYLRNRSTYYGLEKRWADRTFWQRRGRAPAS